IIDKDGEFIYHPNHELSWSRYLPDKQNFLDLFPILGKELLIEDTTKAGQLTYFSIATQFHNQEQLRVILQPNQDLLSRLTRRNAFAAIVIAFTVIFVSIPLSWVAAMVPAKLQEQLHETLAALRHTTHMLDENVMSSTTDSAGVIVTASHAFCETTGYKLWELKGNTHRIVRHPETPDELCKNLWETITQGKVWHGEMQNRTKSGQDYWVNIVITPELDSENNITGYTQISQNITNQKIIETISNTDTLTHLYNRRRIDELLAEQVELFERYQRPFSIILLDLDHFKQVNDTYGHQKGDAVLICIASCLQEHTRRVDFVGRWGGEEFLVICPMTEASNAEILAEHLRSLIGQAESPTGTSLSASFGVAQCQDGESVHKLIGRADSALYEAKDQGRNCVVLAKGTATQDSDVKAPLTT
ncbi:MAG: sensor domain-containing diguanylate cyclase, partial [Sedimenticola sp.]|nr:sensor domain-containing diguanylate cyclase [Sedimenticola sp.]